MTVRNVLHARRIALARLERVAGRCDRLVRDVRKLLLQTLPETPDKAQLYEFRTRANFVMKMLASKLRDMLAKELARLCRLTYRDTRRLMARRYRKAREARLLREDPTFGFDFAELVLPAPDVELLRRIIGIAPSRITRAASNDSVTSTITQGIADGWDRRKISAEIERVFEVTASTARRIVRTEGLRVATESQLAVSEQLGDLVTGYRINAVLDSRTRPDHRERHGTIYYRNPEGKQLGFRDMPHPPVEADMSVSWNCRCFLIPIFS